MVVIEQSSLANPPIDMHRDASTDPLPIQTRFRSRLLAYFSFQHEKNKPNSNSNENENELKHG